MSFKILYSKYSSEVTKQNELISKYRFPSSYMEKIERIKDMKNRAATLAGHSLLAEALKLHGLSRFDLYNIKYDKYRRPYIEGDLDFNIAHTSGMAICAITNNGRIGVDIEKIRDFNINDCKQIFSAEEWDEMNSLPNKLHEFYRLWTLKEAVTKADGQGFYVDPSKVVAIDGVVNLEDNTWNILQIDEFPGFFCHIAYNGSLENYELINAEL